MCIGGVHLGMKHNRLLVCLVGLGFPAGAAVAEWVTTPLDPRVSVQAPVTLRELDLARILRSQGASEEAIARNGGTHTFLAQDAVGSYTVLVRRIGGTDLTAHGPAVRTAFYDQYLKAVLQSERGELLARAPFSVSGQEGVDYRYRGLNKGTGRVVLKLARALVVGNACYTLNYTPADQDSTGQTGALERTRFFGSLVVQSPPSR